MDPISYGVAAKQKQRIEKVIAEPDSDSGIVTTPSTIAVGETITIPAGRTAVLPNTTVNGTLVVDGEVFIPSGSSYTATNINITGTGSRITGDFSNSTVSARTMFQSNILNGATQLGIVPNGTSTHSMLRHYSTSDANNASTFDLSVSGALGQTYMSSDKTGTGTYLPMTFWTSGSERMRIDTSGNVLVTGSGGLGYGTDSGGTVTQLTSKSTAVTLNKPSGRITMNNAALAAGASVTFLLYTNTLSSLSMDNIAVNIVASSIGNQASYSVIANTGAGGAFITLKNESAGSLSEAVQIQFSVIKGATA